MCSAKVWPIGERWGQNVAPFHLIGSASSLPSVSTQLRSGLPSFLFLLLISVSLLSVTPELFGTQTEKKRRRVSEMSFPTDHLYVYQCPSGSFSYAQKGKRREKWKSFTWRTACEEAIPLPVWEMRRDADCFPSFLLSHVPLVFSIWLTHISKADDFLLPFLFHPVRSCSVIRCTAILFCFPSLFFHSILLPVPFS